MYIFQEWLKSCPNINYNKSHLKNKLTPQELPKFSTELTK